MSVILNGIVYKYTYITCIYADIAALFTLELRKVPTKSYFKFLFLLCTVKISSFAWWRNWDHQWIAQKWKLFTSTSPWIIRPETILEIVRNIYFLMLQPVIHCQFYFSRMRALKIMKMLPLQICFMDCSYRKPCPKLIPLMHK